MFYLRCTDKVHAEAHCLALGDGRQELGEEDDEASEPVRMRVMTGLGMDKREEFARRANEMEDEAIAVGADPNVWLRGAFKADVVYGVWQDFNEPGDVGVAMLKGWGAMDRIIATGKKETLGYTWVRCQSIEQTEAMYRELGDGAGARM